MMDSQVFKLNDKLIYECVDEQKFTAIIDQIHKGLRQQIKDHGTGSHYLFADPVIDGNFKNPYRYLILRWAQREGLSAVYQDSSDECEQPSISISLRFYIDL